MFHAGHKTTLRYLNEHIIWNINFYAFNVKENIFEPIVNNAKQSSFGTTNTRSEIWKVHKQIILQANIIPADTRAGHLKTYKKTKTEYWRS